MMTRRTLLAVLPCLLLATAAPTTVEAKKADKKAQKLRDRQDAREALQRGEILPLAEILVIASRHAQGDVVEIELERKKMQFIYEVKLLTPNGDLRKLKLDARDGGLINSEIK